MNYHMVLNTDQFGITLAAGLIIEAAALTSQQPRPPQA